LPLCWAWNAFEFVEHDLFCTAKYSVFKSEDRSDALGPKIRISPLANLFFALYRSHSLSQREMLKNKSPRVDTSVHPMKPSRPFTI
jgi:hypothetical protein